MKVDNITERFPDCTVLQADGFDDAILGYDPQSERVVYDAGWCVGVLMERDKMSYDEAIEYFEFNVSGAYVGEHTPLFIYHVLEEQ
jgi:hypothetical protein